MTEWEKVPAKHISEKGVVCTIIKELLQVNNKETNSPVLKWAKS